MPLEALDGLEPIDQIAPGQAPEPAAQPEKKKDDDPIRELRDEFKSIKRELAETREDAKYWREQANRGGRATPEPEAEPEPEPDLGDLDLTEVVTANDSKGLVSALKKLGFVSRKEVEAEIAQKTGQLTHEAKLYSEFPDMQDDASELFQRTAEIHQDLCRDPDMAKSKRLIETATKMAAAELGIEPRSTRRARPSESDRTPRRERVEDSDRRGDYEDEEERVSRVRAQQGVRGRTPGRKAENPDATEELSPTQKTIVQRLRDAGANITEEGYAKRALRGISMSGLPPARRGKR